MATIQGQPLSIAVSAEDKQAAIDQVVTIISEAYNTSRNSQIVKLKNQFEKTDDFKESWKAFLVEKLNDPIFLNCFMNQKSSRRLNKISCLFHAYVNQVQLEADTVQIFNFLSTAKSKQETIGDRCNNILNQIVPDQTFSPGCLIANPLTVDDAGNIYIASKPNDRGEFAWDSSCLLYHSLCQKSLKSKSTDDKQMYRNGFNNIFGNMGQDLYGAVDSLAQHIQQHSPNHWPKFLDTNGLKYRDLSPTVIYEFSALKQESPLFRDFPRTPEAYSDQLVPDLGALTDDELDKLQAALSDREGRMSTVDPIEAAASAPAATDTVTDTAAKALRMGYAHKSPGLGGAGPSGL